MGSAAVTLYHVEFDVDFDTNDEDDARDELTFSFEPTNLKLTKIKPQYEAGWYQDIDSPTAEVGFWSQQQVDEWGESYRGKTFDQEFRRMKDPEPYEEISSGTWDEVKDLPNGTSLRDKDGDLWYKAHGEWEMSSKNYDYDIGFTPGDHFNYEPYTVVR
jgi:hypothetical protein